MSAAHLLICEYTCHWNTLKQKKSRTCYMPPMLGRNQAVMLPSATMPTATGACNKNHNDHFKEHMKHSAFNWSLAAKERSSLWRLGYRVLPQYTDSML